MENGCSPALNGTDGDDECFNYFAFGSNMLSERLRLANPSAVYVCNGLLEDFRLTFGGFGLTWHGAGATVEESKGDAVCGVVWKISHAHAESLDLQETFYRRLTVQVKKLIGDETTPLTEAAASSEYIICRTYQMIDKTHGYGGLVPQSGPFLPSPCYKMVIVAGAAEHRLPLSYQKSLQGIIHNGHIGDPPYKLTIFSAD